MLHLNHSGAAGRAIFWFNLGTSVTMMGNLAMFWRWCSAVRAFSRRRAERRGGLVRSLCHGAREGMNKPPLVVVQQLLISALRRAIRLITCVKLYSLGRGPVTLARSLGVQRDRPVSG